EESVSLVRRRAAQEGIPVALVPSPGFLDAVLPAVGLDVGAGVTVLDAVEPQPPANGIPTVYYQVYNRLIASDLKLALLDHLPAETEVWHVQAAGSPAESAVLVPLHRLDHLDFDHLTSVVIPARWPSPLASEDSSLGLGNERAQTIFPQLIDSGPGEHFTAWSVSGHEDATGDGFGFERLVALMRTLRGPGGCPWDLEQTSASLRRYVLEEAYEVVDCIDRQDTDELPGELGDLLLQVVFHAQIAAEHGQFDIRDVVDSICEKLVRRHPHVFGDVSVTDSSEVLLNWEAIKREERSSARGQGDSIGSQPESLLGGVPVGLPAVSRADKLFRKAARVGFDWPDAGGALDKTAEELQEVREAVASGSGSEIADEVGDLFLAVINAARKLGLDPETTIRDAVLRFVHRFSEMERLAALHGRRIEAMSASEQDELWETAKRTIRGSDVSPDAVRPPSNHPDRPGNP
ncbi:MAG: nucleoside triphosphate pyrophosphohydrolase, partial [Chloroflexi bacterium]|nr:nucleoside triphosphate pyrophosphohydrolase [Chloroflexota bacterium]